MAGDFPSYTSQNQGFFMPYDPTNYQTNGRMWNGNYRFKSRGNFTRNGVFEASTELPRGPRADSRSNPSKPSAEEDQLGPIIQKKYNKEDFKTQYDNALFYVIKSYSEDDIHKCVKYDVWSSTPNGNKKLDAAFRDAEGKASGAGSSCPVFLFFSVSYTLFHVSSVGNKYLHLNVIVFICACVFEWRLIPFPLIFVKNIFRMLWAVLM